MLSRRTKKSASFQDENSTFSDFDGFQMELTSDSVSVEGLSNNKSGNGRRRRKKCWSKLWCLVLVLLAAGAGMMKFHKKVGMILMHRKNRASKKGVMDTTNVLSSVMDETKEKKIEHSSFSEEETVNEKCTFRTYPANRFYNLLTPYDQQPNFLSTEALYIRGKLPTLLQEKLQWEKFVQPRKVCIDTSEWEKSDKDVTTAGTRPFTDGQNPCFVSLASHPYEPNLTTDPKERLPRLNPTHIHPILELFQGRVTATEDLLLGAAVFGDGQCKWKMSPEDIIKYQFSKREKAPSHRTVITIMHAKTFENLGQATLLLEQDAFWGRRKSQKVDNSDAFARSIQQFDDARFFFHDGYVWVLYRNGPMFGYNDQVQNRLHFERSSQEGFVAYVKASETITVCCGRNMAFFTQPSNVTGSTESLKLLTWVDPVTVVDVDISKVYPNNILQPQSTNAAIAVKSNKIRKRLLANVGIESNYRNRDGNDVTPSDRRKLAKTIKSNIHGTNGFLIPLKQTSELLGIAHFHRPDKRDTSDFALHGHHYTHAFFTILHSREGHYRLSRLSNEFVFRTMSSPPRDDADIIQFAAGLDLIGSDKDGKLLVSYGINDCEGAAFYLDMQDVQQLLLNVSEGQEVVDLMQKIYWKDQ